MRESREEDNRQRTMRHAKESNCKPRCTGMEPDAKVQDKVDLDNWDGASLPSEATVDNLTVVTKSTTIFAPVPSVAMNSTADSHVWAVFKRSASGQSGISPATAKELWATVQTARCADGNGRASRQWVRCQSRASDMLPFGAWCHSYNGYAPFQLGTTFCAAVGCSSSVGSPGDSQARCPRCVIAKTIVELGVDSAVDSLVTMNFRDSAAELSAVVTDVTSRLQLRCASSIFTSAEVVCYAEVDESEEGVTICGMCGGGRDHIDCSDAFLCVVLVLGDFTEGGEILFNNLGIVFKCRPGDVLMFRSHSIRHQALRSSGGVRGALVWFTHLDFWRDASRHK